MAEWTVPATQCLTDDAGRDFRFVHVDNGTNRLGVHFSAFFGDWGDDPRFRQTFGGYFHRLRMLGSDPTIDWLFLCDAYGADKNGTYYIGRQDDRFVERAVDAILDNVGVGTRYRPEDIVMVGSSMGATGALRSGIDHHVRGIVAISPHIDLDICAAQQGRERHVAWVLTDHNTQAEHNHPITREIRRRVADGSGPLPSLFIQSCEDDDGVHKEQVLPLIGAWALRGEVWADIRRHGGHTSEYATRALLLDVIHRLLGDSQLPIDDYKRRSVFRPYGRVHAASRMLRRSLGRLRRRLRSDTS